MTPATVLLKPLLRRQDGAVTTAQALGAGVTPGQLRTLIASGWSRPTKGVWIQPQPADAFRASVRAALLVCPSAAACRTTAARLHDLWGLPVWTATEPPELMVPPGVTRTQRSGLRIYFGLKAEDRVVRSGIPVTTVARTVRDLACVLKLDDLVCLLDSALRLGWTVDDCPVSEGRMARLRPALLLADRRSESPLETVIRLLLVRAGLTPETLQLRLFTRDGVCYARLALAWPSRKLAVEADGREPHDAPDALYRDRSRQNDLVLAGWTVLRFTWSDVRHRPAWVVAQVRRALAAEISTNGS